MTMYTGGYFFSRTQCTCISETLNMLGCVWFKF